MVFPGVDSRISEEIDPQEEAMATRRGVGVTSNPEMSDGVVAERPRTGGVQAKPLSVDEVKSILSQEIGNALGGLGSRVSEEQQTALRMYYGKPLGNEVDDRSQVVLMDTLETVEWALPSLMRAFTGSSRMVKFKPKRPEDQKKADLATAYINHVFVHEMDGFQILYDWFKTSLIEKNAIVKVYFENRVIPQVESYEGLSFEELAVILERDNVEPVSVEERSIHIQNSDTGVTEQLDVYDIQLKVLHEDKRIRVDGVAPEEFLISRGAVFLDDDTMFSAQRKKVTISDLVSQGYPLEILSAVPPSDGPDFADGRTARRDDEESYPSGSGLRSDVASRELWTTECYARIDEDGDGYAELRRLVVVGDGSLYVLSDDHINFNPFCSITPVPMPHRFYGQSLADLVTDLQVIRSTILRQMLDHLYLANNPRMAITEGMVEVDDLLTVRPGGLVRQRGPDSIQPLVTQELPRDTFPMLQYLEQVRSNRTGVIAHGKDMDASLLSNTTAAAVASMEGAKQQKIELIARIFAATGMKQLFTKMFRLMATHDTKARQVRLSGEWMEIDPTIWDFDFDVEVEVGHGAGRAHEQVQSLTLLMQVQGEMIKNGGMGYLVTPKNLYESASRLAESMGYANAGLFFQDPENVPPPEPEPNPDMEKIKLEAMKAQSDSEIKSGDMQLSGVREQNLKDHRAAELESKERLEFAQIESNEKIALGQQQAQVESATIAASSRKSREKGEE